MRQKVRAVGCESVLGSLRGVSTAPHSLTRKERKEGIRAVSCSGCHTRWCFSCTISHKPSTAVLNFSRKKGRTTSALPKGFTDGHVPCSVRGQQDEGPAKALFFRSRLLRPPNKSAPKAARSIHKRRSVPLCLPVTLRPRHFSSFSPPCFSSRRRRAPTTTPATTNTKNTPE